MLLNHFRVIRREQNHQKEKHAKKEFLKIVLRKQRKEEVSEVQRPSGERVRSC